jgi:hypothetical protein
VSLTSLRLEKKTTQIKILKGLLTYFNFLRDEFEVSILKRQKTELKVHQICFRLTLQNLYKNWSKIIITKEDTLETVELIEHASVAPRHELIYYKESTIMSSISSY